MELQLTPRVVLSALGKVKRRRRQPQRLSITAKLEATMQNSSQNPSSFDLENRWRNVVALLNELEEHLETLNVYKETIGPERISSLNRCYGRLHEELLTIRDSYPAHAATTPRALDELQQKTQQILSKTKAETLKAYERVRELTADPSKRQAVREGLGEIGRGTSRAGQEVLDAIRRAADRIRGKGESKSTEEARTSDDTRPKQ
jgi:hypothetical protein